MRKLYISIPTAGKADEKIKEEWDYAVEKVKEIFGHDIRVINDVFKDDSKDPHSVIQQLGQSVLTLKRADIVYFGNGWRGVLRCMMENQLANAAHLQIVETQ